MVINDNLPDEKQYSSLIWTSKLTSAKLYSVRLLERALGEKEQSSSILLKRLWACNIYSAAGLSHEHKAAI